MAVLRSGILGRASGKVAGVVGGHWKDKAYIREYVVPANPNTTPQQTQRGLFSRGVAFLKALVGPVMNVYVDKFQKSMSGFNYILGINMAYWTDPITWGSVKVVLGKLWGPATAAFHTNISHMTISWDNDSYGNNGAASDKVYAAARDRTTGLWYFPAAEVLRSVGTISIALPDSADDHVIDAYIWTAKYSVSSPTLLEMVSDSSYVTGTYTNAP